MKNVKPVAQATLKISEKFLLVGVGSAALLLSLIDPRFENMKLAVQVIGSLCFVLGFAPMAWSFVKSNLPGKK